MRRNENKLISDLEQDKEKLMAIGWWIACFCGFVIFLLISKPVRSEVYFEPGAQSDTMGKVACARPSVGGFAIGKEDDRYGGVFAQFPLSGKDCKEVTKLQKQLMRYEVLDRKYESMRKCMDLGMGLDECMVLVR